MRLGLAVVGLVGALVSTPEAFAQGSDATRTTEAAPSDAPERADQPPSVLGLGLGAGLAIQLGRSAVEEAELDSAGLVRVSREADGSAGLVLEGHYLFAVRERGDTHVGIGPFVAVQTGSDNEIVDSVGLGALIGLRRGSERQTGWGTRFNIGIGVMFDPNVRKLGDGIEKNQPLPPGETQIRYREEHAYRGTIIVTFPLERAGVARGVASSAWARAQSAISGGAEICQGCTAGGLHRRFFRARLILRPAWSKFA